MQQKSHSILILGAGYGGLLCAVRLAGRLRREIKKGVVRLTVVNASESFIERLRLHQAVGGYKLRDRRIADILRGTGVRFIVGTATKLDPDGHALTVQTAEGVTGVPYTTLVLALGSTIDVDSVSGVREFAYTLTPTGERSAPALKAALTELNQRGGTVTVVGAGATGIEAAGEFAGKYRNLHVRLVTRSGFANFRPQVARLLRKGLERRRVEIIEHTPVTEVRAGAVVTAAGETLPHDLCLWTGGFRAPDLARAGGLSVNGQGRVWVDPMLRAVSHTDIYAIGDAGIPQQPLGVPYRMSAVVASISGAYMADQLAARVRGKPVRPFRFAYLGQGIATGPGSAVGYGSTPFDVPKPPYFTGRLGWAIREIAVRYLANAAAFERRLTGAFVFWVNRKGRKAMRVEPSRAPVHEA